MACISVPSLVRYDTRQRFCTMAIWLYVSICGKLVVEYDDYSSDYGIHEMDNCCF